MGLPPAPSIRAFHVEATAVSLIAIVVTILRISYRIHRKLAWWDDLLVGMAACFLVLLLIGVWLSTAESNLPQKVQVAAYYMCTYAFTLTNYSARLSILLGILRIAPNPRTRLFLKCSAGLFCVICCVLLAQKIWVCDGNSEKAKAWKTKPNPDCPLGKQVSLTELCTDLLSDGILVITPISFFARSKIKASQKRRLYAIFGASVATTIVSVVQDWLILAAGGIREITASLLEVSVSVIVASLPVIISFIYRMRGPTVDTNTTRYATDYDARRRAKPGVWANGTNDLTSSSGVQRTTGGTRTSPTSLAVQLSELRHPSDHQSSVGSPMDEDKDQTRDVELELDEDASFEAMKQKDLEASSDIGARVLDSRIHEDDDKRKGGMKPDFAVSAISYDGGLRIERDAEYGIKVMNEFFQYPSDGDGVDDYAPTTYGNYNQRPFTNTYSPSLCSASMDTPNSTTAFTSTRRDSYQRDPPSFTPTADLPTSGRAEHAPDFSSPSVPGITSPTAARLIRSQHRRDGLSGAHLGRVDRSDANKPIGRSASTSSDRSRSRSRLAGGPDDVSIAESAVQGPSVGSGMTPNPNKRSRSQPRRNVFRGSFASSGGVLVHQHVVVSSDPESSPYP